MAINEQTGVEFETPDYIVVRTDGAFEVRDYPPLSMATVAMSAAQDFDELQPMFDFVSGGNATNQSIEMTSPVFLTGEQTRAMSFIMPQEVVEKGVPAPRDSRVQLEEVEAARWVALRFAGEQSPEVFGVTLGKLRAYLGEKGIAEQSEPTFAVYDPPGTPIAERRNEVLVRVGESA